MGDAVKLYVSLMKCPLIIANFGITLTNNVFLINPIFADVLCCNTFQLDINIGDTVREDVSIMSKYRTDF